MKAREKLHLGVRLEKVQFVKLLRCYVQHISAYFRDTTLRQHVIPFLRDPSNVLDTDEAIFLHDKAPCMKANATQHLVVDEDVNFWGNSIWPGNSLT